MKALDSQTHKLNFVLKESKMIKKCFQSLQSHVMSLRVQYTNFTRTSTSLQHFQSADSKWNDVIGGMRTKAEQRWNRLMDLVVSLEDSLWDRIAYYGKVSG